MATLTSQRLTYERLSATNLAAFHALAIDEHIRRYLLDGQIVDLAWCDEQLAASDSLFAERSVGIWLASLAEASKQPLGFCGFIRFPETGPEPQLLYALLPAFTGQGFATEMATALVDYVRAHTTAREIISAVDEPNAASCRVLEKLGFERTHTSPGAFGNIVHYKLVSPTMNDPVDRLSSALRTLLEAELAAGNEVQDFGADFPRPGSFLVRLRRKFRAIPAEMPDGVVYRELNDVHWWQAEYEHTPSGHYLVCGFE